MQEEPFSTGEFFTIEQLALEADTSVRTIRYYTQEGLLPPPDARGRYALYTAAHRDRLKVIQRLKDAFLPLWAIKAQLHQWTDAEAAEFLSLGSEWEQTALQILQKFAPPAQRPPPAPRSGSEPSALQESAVDYIARVLAGKKGELPNSLQSPSAAPLRPAGSPQQTSEPVVQSPVPQSRELAAKSLSGGSARSASAGTGAKSKKEGLQAEETQEEAWLRVPLTPALEVHARLPLSPETERQLAAIRTAFDLYDRSQDEK